MASTITKASSMKVFVLFGILLYSFSLSGCYTVLWSTDYQMPKVDEYREDFKQKDIYGLYTTASDEYYDYYALPWWASTREYFDTYPYTPGSDYTQPGAVPYTAPATENNSRHPQQVIAAPSRNTTQSKTPPAETKTETPKDNSRESGGSTQSIRDNDGGRGNSGGGRR